MILYNQFFFILFKFFHALKSDFVSNELIAFKVVVVTSLLPIFNISLLPFNVSLVQRFSFFFGLVIVNYFLFVYKKRYVLLAKKFRLSPPSDTAIVLSVLYIFGSIIAYMVI